MIPNTQSPLGPEARDQRLPLPSMLLCAAAIAAGAGMILARAIWTGSLLASASVTALAAFAGVAALILGWRLVLVAKYQPIASPPADDLASVTVLVPAFNEGRQVYDTLASLAASDYPRDRLTILAIDDGSTDDTWSWIERARRDFGIQAERCLENRGKRHALYRGFQKAEGEIVVTVDSDSEVRADTLRNLVAPLVLDPEVGAVAGVVRVLNRRSAIPRMLDVSFTYAFEFIRASESMLGGVVCCPGALSAYRRSLIEQVKEAWLSQKVFGRPANIGEDRALTNHVLRMGYRVVLQSNAVVYTEVPTQFSKLARMLLRWARSNVRETFVLGSFVFTRFREGPKAGMRLLFVQHALSMVTSGLLFVPGLVVLALHPSLVLAAIVAALVSAAVPSAVYATRRRPKHCVWGFAYGIVATFGLTWIMPFALVTAHRTGWLTRSATPPGSPHLMPRLAAAATMLKGR